MLAVSWGMAVPFLRSVFAQRLIIESNLRWRRVATGDGAIVVIGLGDFEDWQMAVYVVCFLMNSVRGVPEHVSSD
jgi:hypothetical protein